MNASPFGVFRDDQPPAQLHRWPAVMNADWIVAVRGGVEVGDVVHDQRVVPAHLQRGDFARDDRPARG